MSLEFVTVPSFCIKSILTFCFPRIYNN